MKNRELKQELIENGKYDQYRKTRRQLFDSNIEDPENVLKSLLTLHKFTADELKESEKIRKNTQQQRVKIKKHLKYLFGRNDFDLYFVTFNFSPETLEKTNANTRKQKVRKTATKADDFILNIDYGSQTEREHYHAIIALYKARKEEYKPDGKHIKLKCFDSYDYGFYDVKKIRRGEKDLDKLSDYEAKLTAHSLKVKQQYVSVKKGTDYQKFQADQKELIEDITERRAVTENMINQKYRYIDQPEQTKFNEDLRKHSKTVMVQTTLGDVKYHERRLQ